MREAPPAFFDTNIFVYADDSSNPVRRQKAVALIEEYVQSNSLIISLQVIQEYYAAATRKLHVDPELAQAKVELMAQMRVVRLQERDIISAIELHRLHKLSFWDAMVVHAARLGGARVLFSEDLDHGRSWSGLTIVNPFR
jgi:predicted nucleic acid-binding protein